MSDTIPVICFTGLTLNSKELYQNQIELKHVFIKEVEYVSDSLVLREKSSASLELRQAISQFPRHFDDLVKALDVIP